MAECPVCMGEGQLDCRDTDAFLGEQFSDEELDRYREMGLVHPVGIADCPECDATGVVSEARLRELDGAARAHVDQALALLASRGEL